MNLDYRDLYKLEASGSYGAFGLDIKVAVHLPAQEDHPAPDVDLGHVSIRRAMFEVGKAIQKAVMLVQIANLPEAQAQAKQERESLLGCFSKPIFVEDIPNGYCPDYCCAHLPWFIVTTTVGRIKIGWRKRVINIDWSETKGTKTSEELFANENVTKDKRAIHAQGYEKAKAYVDAINTGSPLT